MTSLSSLSTPGHPALLQQILTAIRSVATTLPVDPIVLQALLTCLIAQDAHLILRTNEEDITPIFRLVVWILSSVFGYTTHKLKVRPGSRSPSHPTAHDYFLKSLFLPPSPSASGSQDEGSEPNKTRRVASRRPRMSPTSPTHMDSPSLSNVSSSSPTAHHVKSPDSGSHHHSHLGNNPHSGNPPSPQLPRAIVISGLENAATSSQRVLAQVLAEKRILFDNFRDDRSPKDGRHDLDGNPFHGTWSLPDGFIFVYVCPIDSRERPNLHNTLLDKFAMSCNVLLKPHIRNILQPIPLSPVIRTNSGPHSASSTSMVASHNKPPLQPRHSHSYSGSHLPSLSTPVFPPAFLSSLREACTKTHFSPTLSLYLADLFSATRHHAQVDGTLLTARCVHDAEKLTKAARVIGVDPTGVELLRGGEDEFDPDDVLPENEDNEDSQRRVPEDELEATGVTGSLRHSTSSLIRGRETPSLDTKSTDSSTTVLDVTEVNIARMFPRCVSHRLRVRDGPREEVLAGAVFGATFGDSFAEETGSGEMYVDAYEARPTVKDILISVMSEV